MAKNPAGLNARLSVGEQVDGEKVYLIGLNDNGADGRDISWIYDADFEKLSRQNIKAIICTGQRAEELALRLKYAEVEAKVIIEQSIEQATELSMTYPQFTVAIPNYTSLSPMHRTLNKAFKEEA